MRSLCLVAIALLTMSCQTPDDHAALEPEDVIGISTSWNGSYGCADCSAVIHDLVLNADSGTFQLFSTYQGTKLGDRSYVRRGRHVWSETVVCLNAEPPNPTECFLLQDANTLVRLDMSGEVTSDELRRK